MAEVIDFPGGVKAHPGNGAREALVAHALEEFANTSREDAEKWADFTLASLWVRGFKVVPLGTKDG